MSAPKYPALTRWDDIRFFLAVLRGGSFTEAARTLATDQSTVSRRIAALEQELDVTLFERTRRAPLPTEAAERLRESAESVEAELTRFRDGALGVRTQGISGRVRVALTEEMAIHFVVPHVLPALRAAYPELVVDLVTGYRVVDLVGREADIALRFFQTERGDLVGRRIARFSTAVLASRAYARRARGLGLRELDWISVDLPGSPTPEAGWLSRHVSRPPTLICSSYEVQTAAIRAGLGVGIGARALVAIAPDFVALERESEPLPVLDLFVVTRKALRSLPRVAAVLDALTSALAPLGDGARDKKRRKSGA